MKGHSCIRDANAGQCRQGKIRAIRGRGTSAEGAPAPPAVLPCILLAVCSATAAAVVVAAARAAWTSRENGPQASAAEEWWLLQQWKYPMDRGGDRTLEAIARRTTAKLRHLGCKLFSLVCDSRYQPTLDDQASNEPSGRLLQETESQVSCEISTGCFPVAPVSIRDTETLTERYTRCRAARRPNTYPVVTYLPPSMITNCGQEYVSDLLHRNAEIVDISHRRLPSGTAEVLLLVEKRSSVHQVDVVTDGDTARWAVTLPASRAFRGHSCLDDSQFCNPATATLTDSGFLVVDRFRVMQFSFSWQPGDSDNMVGVFGQMNSLRGATESTGLLFPGSSAVYKPYNTTHFNETFAMTRWTPNAGYEYLFVSDTGNHRVIMLNTTGQGQMDYISQFGVNQDPRQDHTGFDWPWGLGVYFPAHEALFGSIFANIFVADRMNNRVVKLNLVDTDNGYGAIRPRLEWGGAYSGRGPEHPFNQTLNQPVGIAVFRHYILVGEATGNCITILMVNHHHTDSFIFVTRLFPIEGVQLTGSIAASPNGYVWYTYVELPARYAVGSFYLAEPLRETKEPTRFESYLEECVNETEYNTDWRYNHTHFYEMVGFVMNATRTNWLFPEEPGYINILEFNLTYSFHFDLWNRTVFVPFGATMSFCQAPPPPTEPPMMSGGEGGWALDGMGRATSGGQRLTCCLFGGRLGTFLLGYCWWLLSRPHVSTR